MAFFNLPKFSRLAGKLFNRSDFIKGRCRTYFAPGQSPNVVTTYKAPTAWRPAGGLLVPPQVVWLTLAPIIGPYGLQFVNGVYPVNTTETYNPPPGPGGSGWPTPSSVSVTWVTTFSDGNSISNSASFDVKQFGSVFNYIYNLVASPAPQSRYSFPLFPIPYAVPEGWQVNGNPFQVAANQILSGAMSFVRSDITDPPVMPSLTEGVQGLFGGVWNPVTYPGLPAWWTESATGDTTVYDQTVPDIIDNERLRLLGIFQDVVSSIRSLRQGKTWARINDMSIAGFLAGNGIYDIEPCLSFELAPPPKPKFFGVDFLHVHCLGASDGGAFPTNDWPVFTSDAPASRAQLADSYKQFVRYRCKVYGPDGTFQEFPQPALIPNSTEFPGNVIRDREGNGILFDNLQGTSNNPVIQTLNDNRIFTVNTENAFLASLVPGTNNFLKTEIPNVKQCGVSFMGTQGKIADASFLLGIIAKHFNFDPDTGNDLPLPGSG